MIPTNTLRSALPAICILLLATVTGCGGSDSDAPDSAAPEAGGTPADTASADQAAPAAAIAGIVGTATLNGDVPERTELETGSDPKCSVMHEDEPLLSDRAIISENGGIKDVFVYIKNPPEGDYAPPAEQAVIDQIGCRYVPHVLGVMTGQEISVENSDPTLHNVRGIARSNRPFNNSQPEGAKPRIKKFDKAEMGIRLKCDIHPWMTAFIFAMDHPFFAVSDDTGAFAITGLPDGEYTVVAWHEKYGEQEGTATFTEGAATTLDFSFEPTED